MSKRSRAAAEPNKAFLSWLQSKGVTWDDDLIDPLAVVGGTADSPSFGVIAKTNLRAGTVVARIAKDGALLSPQSCLARDALRKAMVGGGLACVIGLWIERYHASQFEQKTEFGEFA
jgi:hypothetical protein